jgi:hypothetical protein
MERSRRRLVLNPIHWEGLQEAFFPFLAVFSEDTAGKLLDIRLLLKSLDAKKEAVLPCFQRTIFGKWTPFRTMRFLMTATLDLSSTPGEMR